MPDCGGVSFSSGVERQRHSARSTISAPASWPARHAAQQDRLVGMIATVLQQTTEGGDDTINVWQERLGDQRDTHSSLACTKSRNCILCAWSAQGAYRSSYFVLLRFAERA